jgi:hypothetical protein
MAQIREYIINEKRVDDNELWDHSKLFKKVYYHLSEGHKKLDFVHYAIGEWQMTSCNVMIHEPMPLLLKPLCIVMCIVTCITIFVNLRLSLVSN